MSAKYAKISVVMPVHNAGRYLNQAVFSILNQTHTNIELILIDDHSTDGAVDNLTGADSRLVIVYAKQRGLVCALNQGLALASGDYIARMDGDDISLADRLQTQLALTRQFDGPVLVGARVSMFTDHGSVDGGYLEYERWINSKVTPEQTRQAIFIESPLPHPTLFCRRDVLTHLGGYRDLGWPEDYDLWLRAWHANIPIAKAEPVLLRWRDHPQRLSRCDEMYSSKQFIALKAHFINKGFAGPVVIWGAGKGGKRLHDALTAEGMQVNAFIDVSDKRIGGTARGKTVLAPEAVSDRSELLLIAVGSRGVRPKIRTYLENLGKREGLHYWFTA